MSKDAQTLLEELARCVREMEDEEVVNVAKDYIAAGGDAYQGIVDGLSRGMEEAGQLYEEGEYFVLELLICSRAVYNGLDVLRPHLKIETTGNKKSVVIGVVEGDTHDIGKNLVKIMMETAGFEVYDLGHDVPPQAFADKAKEVGASIVCMSTLMTTAMHNMKVVVDCIKDAGIRDQVFIMVGGGPISQAYADKIGADLYVNAAAEAAEQAKQRILCE